MCKQLNGPVLKSLNPKPSGPKSNNKKCPGQAQAEISISLSRRPGPRPKFLFLSRSGQAETTVMQSPFSLGPVPGAPS